MPRGLSSLGCNDCRKQKKRCDLAKPSCSRCTRLRILCVGAGQQRYKFKEQMVGLKTTNFQQVPSNEITAVISAFASSLEVTDLRYNIGCYGKFLQELPKRLGSNRALDASVAAMASAFPSLHNRQFSEKTLANYGRALTTLRLCLSDPVQAWTAETLCAIYLVMILQGWMARHAHEYACAGEVMAQILNTTATRKRDDPFEKDVVLTMCIPVIIESGFNPKIQMEPWLDKIFAPHGPPRPVDDDENTPIQTLEVPNLAKIPRFIQNPLKHFLEIQFFYQRHRIEFPKVRRLMSVFDERVLSYRPSYAPLPVRKDHCQVQVAYGLMLGFGLILNSTLRAQTPHDTLLAEESVTFVDEMAKLAEDASQYRPLGASYIPLGLIPAWAAAYNSQKRMDIERILSEYQVDFDQVKWFPMALWLKKHFDGLRFTFTNSLCSVDLEGLPLENFCQNYVLRTM